MNRLLCLIVFLLVAISVQGQERGGRPLVSPEVHADRTVTFRYKDATSLSVSVDLEGRGKPLAMVKGEGGVWTATTEPLAPEIYGYHFVADGEQRVDTRDLPVRANMFFVANYFRVPGATPQPWEVADVPHGVVHHQFYRSKVVGGLDGAVTDYFVYTPPGYDARAAKPYPVLYLLHGWSQLTSDWTEIGDAHIILDNLIAAGKVAPMVVVMPNSYGDMSFVRRGFSVWSHPEQVDRNVKLFTESLLTEVIPQAESAYRIAKSPEGRAISGLSMGGMESLYVGLNHPEVFGWVGGFSGAVQDESYVRNLASIHAKADARLRLLWIACGKDDELITPTRALVQWLNARNVSATAVETPGRHTWMVWREDLVQFAPLLFRAK